MASLQIGSSSPYPIVIAFAFAVVSQGSCHSERPVVTRDDCSSSKSPGVVAKYQLNESGASVLDLKNASSNLFVLRSRELLDPRLQSGIWIVMFGAKWDAHTLPALDVASCVAETVDGKAKVGFQDFEAHEELNAWNVGFSIDEVGSMPLWVVFVDGKIVKRASNPVDASSLVRFVMDQKD